MDSCLYLIRVRHTNLFVSTSEYNIFDAMTHKKWSLDYQKMIDSLSHALCEDGKISLRLNKRCAV